MKKIIAALAAFIAVCTAAAVYLERKYLRTDSKKFDDGVTEENVKWIKASECEDVYMISRDGFCLHGAVFENNSDNWIVVVHGYDSELMGMVGYARKFLEEGYSVFMPDLRGFGLSDDVNTTMGHLEKNDVIDWINMLITKRNAKNIILFGVSMGAATVMLASGEKLPENVRAVVEDCGYSSVREEFEYNIKNIVHLPPYPILWICDIITRLKKGWSLLHDGDCKKAVSQSKIPILFIHGSNDTFVPFYMEEILYNQCRHSEKEILVVKGANHTEASVIEPERYWEKVFSFIEKHI